MPDFKVQMAKAQTWVQKNPWKTLAAIFLAFAAWFLYQGSDIFLQNKAERDVLEARDQVVSKAGPLTASYSAQMMAAYKISVPTMSDEGLKLTFKNAV